MDPKTMEAGRKLDALIAARVMGQNLFDLGPDATHGYIKMPGDNSMRFAPSIYLEDAWVALEEMESRGYEWRAHYEGSADPKTALHVIGFGCGAAASAPTMPLAICRGIMLALEDEDVSYMKAGRELDREVAEKWMGRKVVLSREVDLGWDVAAGKKASSTAPECIVRNLKGDEPMMQIEGEIWCEVPRYSTVMADAWKAAERDGEFTIKSFYTGMRGEEGSELRFECDFYEAQYSAEAETAPLAICLAALQCVGALPRKTLREKV